MAKYNLDKYTSADGLGFPLNFRRGNPNPLDNSSVWASLEAAQNYASTDPVAYVGQILTVVDNAGGVATVYAIQDESGALKKVGTSPVGDESTITVAEDGTVSLYGVAGLELTRTEDDGSTTKINYQPLLVDGKLTWIEPSATTVEGLAAEIEGLKTRLSAVETVVGNAESGLVKDVADNTAAITAAEEAISAIKDGTTIDSFADVETALAGKQAAGDYATKTEAQGYADAKDAAIAAAKKAGDDAQAGVDALEAKVGAVTEGKTVVEMIAEAQEAATYDDTALTGRVTTVEGQVTTLIGSDVSKSAREIASEEVAKIVAGADASYDTLKEIADWISSHKTDATAMNSAITALEGIVDGIGGEGEKATVVEYVTDAIAALKIGDYAKAADLTALASKVTTAEGKITTLEGKAHEHTNKALLDTYTQTEVDLADAVAKKHEHTNKAVLDGITSEKVAAWDAADQNIIEAIKVNGVGQAVVDKAVDITVPTKLDQLTGYDTLTSEIGKKVDAVDGKSLVDDNLIIKLGDLANIKTVSSGELTISEDGELSITAVDASKVTGLSGALNGKVDKVEGKGLSANDFTDELLSKLTGIEAGAQVNDLEVVKIAGIALPISDKAVDIPVATTEALGIVMSSSAENKVSVGADGTMEVNNVNVNKLVQDENTVLILNGGNASV